MLPAFPAATKKAGLTVPVKYEGGTLPLGQNKIKATIAENEIVFVQGNRRYAIPVGNIAAVTCGIDVRRRFGATVLSVVPRMHLEKAETYYVGITLNAAGKPKGELVLKLSNGEYRDFLAALERITGMKAVNAAKVPTVVRYEL
jgi:hypothetical protein